MNQNDDWNDKRDDDGAQKTDANVDDPALLPSVGSRRARRAPPKSSTPQPPSLLHKRSLEFQQNVTDYQILHLLNTRIAQSSAAEDMLQICLCLIFTICDEHNDVLGLSTMTVWNIIPAMMDCLVVCGVENFLTFLCMMLKKGTKSQVILTFNCAMPGMFQQR